MLLPSSRWKLALVGLAATVAAVLMGDWTWGP